jgi:hypothetical protein
MGLARRIPAIATAFAVLLARQTNADHAVPNEHPRLLGSRARLQQLALDRPAAYQRMKNVANDSTADDYSRMMSLALVAAIEQSQPLARAGIQNALAYVNGPIKVGHIPFGTDLALCAMVYDLCYEYWTAQERTQFIAYMNKTVDTNVTSETAVFHNAWYGYKNWGEGIASYATYYENPKAPGYLSTLYADYQSRAVPALAMAGNGGGWAEGYYVHYWSYEWMFFCEVAGFCEGKDLYAMAPVFYRNRAAASMFEMYPGISDYGSRRPIPMGDGGGRVFGGDRDKALSARRILVNHFRDDTLHQYIHSYNETTPRSSVGNYAYKDFLWRDTTVSARGLAGLTALSLCSRGAGYVYARGSWDDTAAYFFFKCGDRFTAHQHLDNGHFLIYKNAELAGDGGHYDAFGSVHDVNYHLRTIAHSTMLVYDPAEQWTGATAYSAGIRAGTVTGNDGGQHHSFPNHNGSVEDVPAWLADSAVYDIADLLAFEDRGFYLYAAGDCSRSYSSAKLVYFTRQIVYLRPGRFVIFDRVASKNAAYQKTWQLQAMKTPTGVPPNLVITNGKGRLFLQTLLPANPVVALRSGDSLYAYGGHSYPPGANTGPAPECRIQISPPAAATVDYFLHVMTATDSSITSVTPATVTQSGDQVTVSFGALPTISFTKSRVGGAVSLSGVQYLFPDSIVSSVAPGGSVRGGESRASIAFRTGMRNGVLQIVPCALMPDWKAAEVGMFAANGILIANGRWSAEESPERSTIRWRCPRLPAGMYLLRAELTNRTGARKTFSGAIVN